MSDRRAREGSVKNASIRQMILNSELSGEITSMP